MSLENGGVCNRAKNKGDYQTGAIAEYCIRNAIRATAAALTYVQVVYVDRRK